MRINITYIEFNGRRITFKTPITLRLDACGLWDAHVGNVAFGGATNVGPYSFEDFKLLDFNLLKKFDNAYKDFSEQFVRIYVQTVETAENLLDEKQRVIAKELKDKVKA